MLTGCGPATLGPIQIHPQDERLFFQGLEQWPQSEGEPEAFRQLQAQYPHSPLTGAASTLLHERRQTEDEKARRHELEQRAARLEAELSDCRTSHRQLTQQVEELNTSLERFKQILLETEGR